MTFRKEKVKGWLGDAWWIAGSTFKEFRSHNSFQVAAALTFITLLSLVPLLVISLSVISQFSFSQNVFLELVSKYFLPSKGMREIIISYLQVFAHNTAGLSIFGGIFLIFTSLSLLNTIEGVFDQIWFSQKRTAMQRFISFWTLITLAPVLFAAALFLSSEILASPLISGFFHTTLIQDLLGYIVPYVLSFVAILVVYEVFSPPEVEFQAAVYGAAVATVLFQVSRWGFAVYLQHFANYWKIYGILGTLPAFFMWIYICWLIFLLGAEVTSVLQFEPQGGSREFKEAHSGFYALKVVLAIVRSFQEGRGPVSTKELEMMFQFHPGVLGGILTRLQERGIIAPVEKEENIKNFLPARSPDRILIRDVLEAFHGDPYRVPPEIPKDPEDEAILNLFHGVRQEVHMALAVSVDQFLREYLHPGGDPLELAGRERPHSSP